MTKPHRSSRRQHARRSAAGICSPIGHAFVFVASLGLWLPQTQAAVLVNLDATALPEGAVDTWANTGTASGNFTSSGTAVPAVVTQAGVKGVSFTGAANHYLGPVVPDVVTGGGTRTIEAWVFNPAGSDFETIIAWGRREGPDNSNSSFSHGVHGTWGAFGGWGAADLDWQGKIAFGRWNYIVYTYDGGESAVYADGVLANSEPITLDTWAFDSVDGNPLPFRVGAQNLANGTVAVNEPATMVIARVRVHDVPLTAAEVAAKYAAEKGFFGYNDDDNDGLPNAYELQYSDILNPNDPTDAPLDQDVDGLSSLREFELTTIPNNPDTDGDGVKDGDEVNRVGGATNPLLADTDLDGLNDGAEVTAGTDPLDADTDDDTYADFQEIVHGSNPTSAASTPTITDPLISLDATALAEGALSTWTNNGALSGDFASSGSAVPAVVTVAGMKGVNFTGAANNYLGPLAPGFMAGPAVRTIEAWVYNPAGSDFETIVAWGRRGGPDNSNSSFSHGVQGTWGAFGGWGAADLNWPQDTIAFGRWNYIVYTYDGTDSNLYADGQPANSEPITLATHGADSSGRPLPFRVGAQNQAGGTIETGEAPTLTMARVRVHDRVLSAGDILAKYNAEAEEFGLVDFDNDGLPTWFERQYTFLNPNNPADAALDQDADGLSNLAEFNGGTIIDNPDSDSDGLNDGPEVNRTPVALNPLAPDTDGDGLTDGQETTTDPAVADTDGDTYADGQEVFHGSNPLQAGSTPTLTPPVRLVDLDASALAAGPLAVWPNAGEIEFPFTAVGTPGVVGTVAGVKALTLDGTQYYRGPAAPGFIAGDAPRTVEAWIYNPAAADEETIFSWGRRGGPDGSNVSFNHGLNAAYGAVGHWGAPDIGWNGNVVVGQWTHVAYTWNPTALTTTVYSNGQVANTEVLGAPLATHATDSTDAAVPLRFLLGAQNEANGTATGGLRGSMSVARVRVHDGVLDAATIAATYEAERDDFAPAPDAPTISGVTRNAQTGAVTLNWTTAAGKTYAVQATPAVPGGWADIATGLATGTYTEAAPPAGATRYYRIRVE